ncbi:hypothetical protein Y032_0044g904 [Ancylostoma ceylanicum]|uniref:Endonuclease/exonuclease/phosphatase domain-containing protein n=1 Tax=Ancylostoma ceylanicum TaxID=53326 RepID=A0A016UEK1_9BILA|nr:hypothetical protein Y032_0044g904 [Ancylostoma ceylanicum]
MKSAEWLTAFFNQVVEEKKTPVDLQRSVIVSIWKRKGNSADCANYRSIRLLSHLCGEDVKDELCDQLANSIRSAPKDDYFVVGGDFNGHVGQDRSGLERVHGEKGVGIKNFDGKRLTDLAEAHDLAIISTFFAKRRSQKITYSSGGRETEIDHVLVRRRWLKTVKDVKAIPGEDVVGQLIPVLVDLDIPFPRRCRPETKRVFMVDARQI